MMAFSVSNTALAAQSLDEITSTVTETTVAGTEANTSSSAKSGVSSGVGTQVDREVIKKETNNTINNLMDATRLDTNSEAANKFGRSAQPFLATVGQILAKIITFGMSLVILLDLVYIAIPPFRGMLGPAGAQGGMNGGMGGMNSGMGGGFGNGMGGGFGRPGYGMNGGMSGGMSQQAPSGMPSLVSTAAIMAANQPNTFQGIKAYFHDVVVRTIITAVLIVLTLTGVLPQLGFKIGLMLNDFISSGIGGMI
jgi:hypothetical protein